MFICLYDDLLKKRVFNEEYIKAIDNNKICVFNSDKEIFCDLSGNPMDLTGKVICPISGMMQVKKIREVANKLGIRSFVTTEDDEKIHSWTKWFKTLRNTKEFVGSDILSEEGNAKIKELFGEEFFIKTKEKNYNAFCKVDYFKNKKSILVKALERHSSEEFILSEKVNIMEDELGKLEYRCVVIDNQARNISRITDDIVHKIDERIKGKLEEVVKRLEETDFPSSYVVDLMVYEKNGVQIVDVIEFNSICSSGMYLYNSIIDLDNSNLMHKDLYKLPQNKEYMKGSLSKDEKIKSSSSKYFQASGSFAETVKEFTGEIMGGIYVHKNSEKPNRYEEDECLGDDMQIMSIADLLASCRLVEDSEFFRERKKDC